ncbi:DUF7093 family protein [Salinibaculum rarum]|uniref:DUF7093 family protein n=1 Tax=Salinibaculum rarum TaxID=3058903 RepID=UPI00265E3B7E|nr:hypothetical protein [Salinibaculum sp. KK48]
MSFKCSVFGHRYGDPDVEREREEQGSEVVITIKETETCKRCGETRVVSENKEVTTLETPSDIVGDDIADDDSEREDAATEREPVEETTPGPTEPEVPAEGGDDAEFIDEAEESTATDSDPVELDQPEPGMEEAADETPDADEDDAVILDEDDEDSEDDTREPGQWPDAADDEDEEEEEDWTPTAESDLTPVEDEQPDIEPTSSAVTVPDGEFYCPECDFTTKVESSSLRAGDFCPECHRGSLTHRSEDA